MAESLNLLYSSLPFSTTDGETALIFLSVPCFHLNLNCTGMWMFPVQSQGAWSNGKTIPSSCPRKTVINQAKQNPVKSFCSKDSTFCMASGNWGFLRGYFCFRRVTLLPSWIQAPISIFKDNKTVPGYSMLAPARNWGKITYAQQSHCLLQTRGE